MNSNDVLRRSIRYVLFANAAAVAGGSVAVAATATTDAPDTTLSEVVVTGSRISQPGLESISPVTTVSSEEIKVQGVTRIEDLLNTLPQVYADQGGNLSNGATGTATVNLRDLGAQRTLVLINGRRLMPGDPTSNGNAEPDLNQIPTALVERVDVLTGGASAVYGADAVAGVVNFVMNDHFQGVRIDANASMNNHHQHNGVVSDLVDAKGFALPSSTVNDGKTKDVTFIIGGNFADDKGNVTAYASYRRLDPIAQAARDFSSCALNGGDSLSCGGSSTSATGAFYFPSVASGGIGKSTVVGNQFAPFTQFYNYAPTNYYQRSDERYTGGLFGHFEFNEHATAYTEFMFMHDDSNAQVAASGAFIGSGSALGATGLPDGNYLINCDNPLLSAQQQSNICAGLGPTDTAQLALGRRNVEGGNRNDDLQHTSFRIVIGAKGEIVEGIKYDVYGMVGKTLYSDYYTNDVSKSRIVNALQAVTDPATGQVICKANAGGTTNAPGCIPYNIWTNGAVTPDQVAYFSVPSTKTGSTDERVVSANVTADLTSYGVKLPTAASGLAVVLGTEYRSERMQLRPDIEQLTNDLSGLGNPVLPLDAGLSVREVFTEARLPILQDIPLAKLLSVETGFRYSKYDLGFSTNTYKFGVDYAPTADVRVRGSYQRAVRAPNLQELFKEKYVGIDGATDPCANTSSSGPPTATLAQCARTGVSAAQYGNITPSSAGQYNGQLAGNAQVKPEKSDTKTFGIVITPTILPALTVTLDYFDIKVKDLINTYGADFTLKECINGVDSFCSLIVRDPSTGSLWASPSGYVIDTIKNLGSESTKGVDLTSGYRIDMGAGGKLALAFNGTWTKDFITEPVPGLGSYNCVGLYGNTCGVPIPKWRHKFRATWQTPFDGLDVSAQWRHIAEVKEDTTSGNPLLAGDTPATDAKLGSRDYLDLSLAVSLTKGVSVRLGVNNVLDKDPPIIAGADFSSAFSNGNTYPQVYDTLGRYMFLNITADF